MDDTTTALVKSYECKNLDDLPDLWRIVYDGNSLRARKPDMKFKDLNDFKKIAVNHLTWKETPTPFVSTFSSEKHALNWANAMIEKKNLSSYTAYKVDASKLDHVFKVADLVGRLKVGSRVSKKIKESMYSDEYWVLGNIPANSVQNEKEGPVYYQSPGMRTLKMTRTIDIFALAESSDGGSSDSDSDTNSSESSEDATSSGSASSSSGDSSEEEDKRPTTSKKKQSQATKKLNRVYKTRNNDSDNDEDEGKGDNMKKIKKSKEKKAIQASDKKIQKDKTTKKARKPVTSESDVEEVDAKPKKKKQEENDKEGLGTV